MLLRSSTPEPGACLANLFEFVQRVFYSIPLPLSTLRGILYLIRAWLGCGSTSEHALCIADTGVVAFLNTLERKCGDECSSDTRSVLSRKNLNGVAALAQWLTVTTGFPVENLLECLCASCLETR